MPTNFYMYFVAGLVPMLMGFIYYHPKVAGTAWMKANGFKMEDMQSDNMVSTMIISYLMACLLAFGLTGAVIHQFNVFGMMYPEILETGSQAQLTFSQLMADYGNHSRSFGHGFLHGFMVGLFLILPIFTTNSLFEKRGWSYILVNTIYWSLTVAVMGGILCATLKWAPLM